jgi:CBS domain-containing protein
MKIRDILDQNIVTVRKDTTYEEAAKILLDNEVTGAPVVDSEGKLVGIITEKDIFKVLFPYYQSYSEHPEYYTDLEERELKAKDIRTMKVEIFMSKNISSITPDEPIMRAGAIMLARKIGHLPVVENGKLVGVVTGTKIFRYVLKNQLNNH